MMAHILLQRQDCPIACSSCRRHTGGSAGIIFRWLTLFCLAVVLLIVGVRSDAQSTPSPVPSSSQIKSDLKEILNRPEFHADSDQPGPLAEAIDKIRSRLESLWHSIQDFFQRLFGGRGSIGTVDIHLVYVVLAILALVAIWLVARVIVQRGGLYLPKRRPITAVSSAPTEEQEAQLPPDEWIERAALAARQNDFHGAFRAVYRAILVQLDRAGKIEYRKYRTNGEYVRTLHLANPKSLYDMFAPLSREFDLHWYGGRPSAESVYLHFLEAYRNLPVLIAPTQPNPAGSDDDMRSDRERS